MFRVLLVLLAVLVAILAFVFDQPWLYVAASVPLIGALGLLGGHLWDAYRRQQEPTSRAPEADEESSESLGVRDVRPQEREGGTNGSSPSESAGPATSPKPDAGDMHAASTPSSSSSESEREAETETAVRTPSEPVATDEQPVLGPYLESLRAALGAETACLLVQEEVVLEYRIEALASTHSDLQRSGTFETQAPLLTATMSRQPVTVQKLAGADGRAKLGYYETPPAIEQVAVAPVDQPDAPATVFLLVDATAETDLSASRSRSLLERFADTVALLRDTDKQAAPSGGETSPQATTKPQTSSPEPEEESSAEESSDRPRPRREIIAEEMEAADAEDAELALVLVHLNRAESIARRGEEAVATAEQLFRTRLEHFAPGERVERFGELTYGIFPRRDVEAVEAWIADLQETMDQETGELEGGVSVGVAVRGPRHDPEGLRADATKALKEAYETGTSTILE